jgi:hypothetical protein
VTGANGQTATTPAIGFNIAAGALPEVLITSPARGATVGSTVRVDFTTVPGDAGTLTCYVNGATAPCDHSGSATLTGLASGDATIEVRVDGVGIGNFDIATVHVQP